MIARNPATGAGALDGDPASKGGAGAVCDGELDSCAQAAGHGCGRARGGPGRGRPTRQRRRARGGSSGGPLVGSGAVGEVGGGVVDEAQQGRSAGVLPGQAEEVQAGTSVTPRRWATRSSRATAGVWTQE